jgi:thiol-disulfide isomerase/thioredoxin
MSMIDRRRFVTRAWVILVLCGASTFPGAWSRRADRAQAADPQSQRIEAPTAEAIVRRTADFFKKSRSMAVDVERVQKLGGRAMPSSFSAAFQRPNRFAIRTGEGGPMGLTIVSDGKKLFTAIPALRKYTETEAPASLDALGDDPIIRGALSGMMIAELSFTDPYEKIMEGVKTAKYAGVEMVDGVKVHHLAFTQDQFDWEMWVAADGDPVIRRITVDLTKAMANMPVPDQFKKSKMELVQNFKNWRFDRDFDAKTFAFEAPQGTQKVDRLFGGPAGGGQPPRSPLVGKPAPDVNLKLLDAGDFRLKDHRDQHLVMLDFWATWCGPCVQELPILTKVAEAYKDKGVVFCAVNEQEKPDQIHQFLKSRNLQMTVALDSAGEVGGAYGAEAIPMLVLIDKKGVVQSVHVGFNPTIQATLPKELDALLAGKNLAEEAHRGPKAALAPKTEGLERAWSVRGPYTGLATDLKGQVIYALQNRGRCDVLDAAGKRVRSFHLEGASPGLIRFARQAGGSAGLISFGTWGPSVLASKEDGTKLWEERGGQGIDDVWAADLDGDGIDEVIVGYNGQTGLHVFSADGKRRWKRTDLGNVWHVTAGDLDGDGKLEVVTTSARGQVHVFAAAGQPLRTLDPGVYANMVRTAPGRHSRSSKGDVVLVIGGGVPGPMSMVSLGGDGEKHWTRELPADAQSCDSLAVSPDGNLAAVGLRGGRVCVIELQGGQILAQTTEEGLTPMVGWAAGTAGPTPWLLVATGQEINAFQIKPAAAPRRSADP